MPPAALGAPMRAFAVGEVVASRHPDRRKGEIVSGLLGVRRHAACDGSDRRVTETGLFGLLGLNGLTA